MHKYVPSKRPLFLIYAVLFFCMVFIRSIMGIIGVFVSLPIGDYFWILLIPAALAALLVLPAFFFGTFFTVSGKEITVCRSFIMNVKTLMPVSSVKSVTTVMLPLSKYTGMNFVVVNSLGGKVVLPFLSKSSALEITSVINHSLRRRAGERHENS